MEPAIHEAHRDLYETHWWFRGRKRILAHILDQLPLPEETAIIDIGSGSGDLIPLLLKERARVIAIESNEDAAARIRQRFQNSVDVRASLADVVHEQRGATDLVTAFDVLEHIEDDEQALTQIFDLLKPGGTLLLTVPACPALWGAHDEQNHHFRRYTKKELRRKLQRAGFDLKLTAYFNFVFFFPMLLVRKLKKASRSTSTDFQHGGRLLSGPLASIFGSERFMVKRGGFPVGASLLCVAKKPANV